MDIREMCERDMPAVLALICVDHLPGQPICTVQDVQNALAGHATIDRGWWEALKSIRTIVVTAKDEIVGVASYGTRNLDDSEFAGCGFILWLHAQENREVTEALVSYIHTSLQHCPQIYAFWIATPLTFGVEALAIEHRPVMHQVLLTSGFTGEDDWLYMKGLPFTQQPIIGRHAEIERIKDGWKLFMYEGHERIAEAEIGLGRDHVGVLWWIEVQEPWRGQGLGKQLLLQARKILGDAGAYTIILYVDHDDRTERNRVPAIQLYQSQSFIVVDHLWAYKKSISLPDHLGPPS